jgi:asparagine synthase (glutamine-hydrolysing)
MSGIGGILIDDGAPVPATTLQALARELPRRGQAGTTQHVEPGLALVHQALREGRGPGQARAEFLRAPGLVLTWDGRLDNHDELSRALGAERCGELECLALAYGRWGLEFLRRVVGDFALALWDQRQRRLVLARDPMATRPLFYTQQPGLWVFGSTLQGIQAASACADALDDEWLAGYFCDRLPAEATPLRAVRAVAPGQALIVEGGRSRAHVFWDLATRAAELQGTLPAWGDAEHEGRFLELFSQAVRVRLREPEQVFAELSGGLDSSSIVCVADALLRAGSAEAHELVTASYGYEISKSGDEREFQQAVEAQVKRPSLLVSEAEAPFFAGIEQGDYAYPCTLESQKLRERRVAAEMRARGARVLLSGLAGDHLVFSSYPLWLPLAEHVYERDPRAFLRELPRWHAAAEAVGRQPYARLAARAVAAVLWPARAGAAEVDDTATFLAWLRPAFVERSGLKQRLRGRLLGQAQGSPVCRRLVASLQSVIGLVGWLHDSGPWPFERAYPFLHRPLVEYCLAAPASQLLRPGETRTLHRRALRALLPRLVAERKDKRGPDEATLRGLAERWPSVARLFDGSRLEALGVIAIERLRPALDSARIGHPQDELLHLLRLIALEVWLRSPSAPGAAHAGAGVALEPRAEPA